MISRRELLVSVATFCSAVAVGTAVGACGDDGAAGPPEIIYGRDVCAECHMIISEARFAAAYRDAKGEPFTFDDVGDMVTFAKRSDVVDTMTAWVHDYNSEKWIDAKSAHYVRGSSVVSPMGHNTVAFAKASEAEEFQKENGGKVIAWSELLKAEATPQSDHDSHQ